MNSIKKRREQVSQFLLKGLTEAEIAEKLGVSRQTIVRDVSYLKISSMTWLDELAKNGFVFECKKALDKINETCRKLEELLVQSDIWQQISILRAIDANRKLYLEMLSEYPTLHTYRKVSKLNPQNVSQA